MRILLIGKTGQLGGDLLRSGTAHAIEAPDRSELDVCSPDQIAAALARYRPDCVVNTAAFHDVPRCELEPERAFRVNCVAVRDLASACARTGTLLVTFSSDYVFGGEQRTPYLEDDRPAPLQIYGTTRLAGEHAALSAAPAHAIVIRTCGLYGASGAQSKGGNFVDARVRDAATRTTLDMGADQVVSPTSTADLARAVLQLLEHPGRAPGLYHLVNEGACTWFELTKAIYEELRLPVQVNPVDRGGRTGDMRRPLYSALANRRARALGIALPGWRDALRRYLAEKHGRTGGA
jgi:dTDP-4-dehydrorhamnose reductase